MKKGNKKSVNDNIPKRIKRHWGVTLFREQQSKAAEGQGRGKESEGRVKVAQIVDNEGKVESPQEMAKLVDG